MSSKNAVALYEMVCLRANLARSIEKIDLQKFRRLVGVPPNVYERCDNLMRFVIRPAILEVNVLSDIGVDIHLVRSHSRAPITAVELCWGKKTGDEFRASIEERNRGKIGRKARLKALAETKSLTSSTGELV
ncbi:MAG TPA: replication initiation protein [Edaphobacter sp.]|nr:replication initiation protein [Edaphobacter sp.]